MPGNRSSASRISIRPGVSVLSVLRHLNYKPWFALAEFVDNALQSFIAHRGELDTVHGGQAKLRVAIQLDPSDEGRLTIRDNAAGIGKSEYARAFRPAEVPTDRTGLSEFGMGMKSAACWFAPRWTVRTSALGEATEKTVHFDIAKIVRDSIEELDVIQRPAKSTDHYTEIVLDCLYKKPHTRTVGKIEEHLASIYRVFLREGVLELTFNDQPLTYESPKILLAPDYRTPSAEPILWRKEIDFDFGLGQRVHGFAALRERASTSHAGFALFRRGRLIEGSGDEAYRPDAIFGKSNSYRYQRLFGELHLEGFGVSHTKDGFVWDEYEDVFLQLLRDELDKEPVPLLKQAEEYRARPRREDIRTEADAATGRTAAAIERDVPTVMERLEKEPPAPEPRDAPASACPSVSRREISVELWGTLWTIILELSDDPAIGEWIELWDAAAQSPKQGGKDARIVGVRMALAHPFVQRFGGRDYSQLEPLVRLAAAIGLAETAARDTGIKGAGTIRRNVNELLRNALANP